MRVGFQQARTDNGKWMEFSPMNSEVGYSIADVFDNRLSASDMDLGSRSAIVTGASSGIVRATAKTLAAAGAQVGLAARTTANLETVADEIEDRGGEALVLPTDVRDSEQVESVITKARDVFDGLDIMVNNAGVDHWEREGVVAGDLDEWTMEIEVNLLGLMYGTHFAAKVMEEEGQGDIVNVGSGSGRTTAQPWLGYVASKWGVRGFTESSMRDLREAGIRVTHLIPGTVETPAQPEEDIESMQMLDPEDVADAILYAVSQPKYVCVNELVIIPSGRE